MQGVLLVVFGVVALVATILTLWLCCCFRQRAPKWVFLSGLVLTDAVLVVCAAVMITYGAGLLIASYHGNTLPAALLFSFSVIPIAAAIGIPIYCCYHRKRQIQEEEEEEGNEVAAQDDTEDAQLVVFFNDAKTSA
ncbi:uncharacterized protein TM35_000101690 [Trypanosoma theileri]|uniref:Uncharacterized protein n=1 Tax=Trypanosoma theileri TaxID=67003 RepID=A0A1X0NZ75_9TRYP|nr:uncharacterized protein TM35_000101690 [Trypanosoma theileri]ORC89901.1 hypothetical protein TM35_000101690 [Trypanosoma theileri]